MARLSITIRLIIAGGLAFVSLGLVWSSQAGRPGMFMGGSRLTNQYNYNTGNLDLVLQYDPIANYLPGSPGSVTYGSQDPMRVVLVPAAVGLLVASRRRTRASRRLAQLSVAGLVVATVFASAGRAATPTIVCALAAVLAASTLSPGAMRRLAASERPAASPSAF